MNLASQVQNQDEAVCISLWTNAPEKGMHSSSTLHPPAMSKIVG